LLHVAHTNMFHARLPTNIRAQYLWDEYSVHFAWILQSESRRINCISKEFILTLLHWNYQWH